MGETGRPTNRGENCAIERERETMENIIKRDRVQTTKGTAISLSKTGSKNRERCNETKRDEYFWRFRKRKKQIEYNNETMKQVVI